MPAEPSDPPAGLTTAELWRRMDSFEKTMEDGFKRLDRRVESLGYVSLDRYEADHRAMMTDIEELKGSVRWFARALGGMSLTLVGGIIVILIETRGGA